MTDTFIINHEQNRMTERLGMDALPLLPWSEGLGAIFEAGRQRNLGRTIMDDAERNKYYDREVIDELGGTHTLPAKQSKILTAQEAQDKYGLDGHLTFDADTPEPVAKQLYDLKVAEILQQEIRARSDVGFGADIIGGILASFTDPINIAASFIPVVGQARYATMAARIGAPAARVTTGAIEGAVGTALLEPFVYSYAQAEQADYELVDSLMNVTFGTVMGAGLHLGVGTISDRWTARRDATPTQIEYDNLPTEGKSAILYSAVKQIDEGRVVDVEPVVASVKEQVERRQLDAIRRDIDSIADPEERARAIAEMRDAALIDPLTGLRNRLAMIDHVDQLSARGPYSTLSMDVSGLKWANDNVAHAFGDILLSKAAQILRDASEELGLPVFRPSGDEYYAFAATEGELKTLLNVAEPKLKQAMIQYTLPDGTIVQKWGLDLYSGIGKTIEEADAGVNAAKERYKAERKAETEAAGGDYRLAEPRGVVRIPPAGREAGSAIPGGSGVSAPTRSPADNLKDWKKAQAEPHVDPTIRASMAAADEAGKDVGPPRAVEEEIKVLEQELADLERIAGPIDDQAGLLDTRGEGTFFHGTSRRIAELQDFTYTTLNYYGQGLYLTDAVDVARGYSKKGRGKEPTVYRAKLDPNAKLFDMEAPFPPEIRDYLSAHPIDVISETLELETPKNMREMYDEMRGFDASADEIQEGFSAIQEHLMDLGYAGLQHIGGLRTNTKPHTVRIYWEPSRTVEIEPINLNQYAVEESVDGSPTAKEIAELKRDEAVYETAIRDITKCKIGRT